MHAEESEAAQRIWNTLTSYWSVSVCSMSQNPADCFLPWTQKDYTLFSADLFQILVGIHQIDELAHVKSQAM